MSGQRALAAVFLEALPDAPRADGAALEGQLAAACARAQAAFANIGIDDCSFVRHLALAMSRDPQGNAELSVLAIEDLYLACGCLEGSAAAASVFRARHQRAIREAIGGIVPSADVEDVYAQFVQDIFVGTGGDAVPKIGTYSGRAPLERWLGVGARRAALMWLRKSQAEGRLRRAVATNPAPESDPSLEADYIKERYRGEFEQALTEALKRLPERDRVILRLCLVSGVSVEKIGTMYKVSQSTVSRWLAAARGALLDDVKETLRRRLGTSSDELASLARMVASRLDLTLASFLKVS